MGLSSSEIEKANQIKKGMVQKNAHKLIQKYGFDAEKRITGRAINMAKKLAEQDMEQNKLREMVKAVLTQPVSEKKGRDMDGDGDVDSQDYLAARDVAIKKAMKKEDLDLGHEDNEPHMIKAELYRIGKYAMELYQMVDQFEGMGEVDFPAWWQSKITTSANNMVSAKHYLDFETKEPEIDAMVSVAAAEDIISSTPTEPLEDEIEEGLPKGYFKKATAELDENQMDMFATKASRTDNAKETYFKFLKDFAKSAGVSGEELGKMSYNDLENKFGEKLTRKYGLKKSNVADRARELVSKGVIQVDESFEKLVGKLKKGGKSEKAAKAIAGAVAQYKAKGGGKGPTAKQKAR